MEDPDEDWDVEAELQRQLDALELSSEEDEHAERPEVPKIGASSSGSVETLQSSFRLMRSDANPKERALLCGDANRGLPEAGGLFGHLEALFKEREKKFDAFYVTLGDVSDPKVLSGRLTKPVNADASAIDSYQNKPVCADSASELFDALSDAESVSDQTESDTVKAGATSKLAVDYLRDKESQFEVGMSPLAEEIRQTLDADADADTPGASKQCCEGSRNGKRGGAHGKQAAPSLGGSDTAAAAASSASQDGKSSAACLLPVQDFSVSANLPPEEHIGSDNQQSAGKESLGYTQGNAVGKETENSKECSDGDGRSVSMAEGLTLEKWGEEAGGTPPRLVSMAGRSPQNNDANGDDVDTNTGNAPAGNLRLEILHLEHQVQLDSLQERHVRVTSAIDFARREELARQADEASLERVRHAAAEAVLKRNEEERRRRVLEREQRMQVIQAQLERAAREAFAAKRIARVFRTYRTSVRHRSAVRLQACARGFLARRAYFRLCRDHSRELLRVCEARNDIRALEAAAPRATALGLAAEADAALQRTRSRVEEARAAVAAAAVSGGLEEFERAREWAVSAGVPPAEIATAEALFASRVTAKLASIDTGIGEGLPLVILQTLMREAQSLGVNKGRLDQYERDVSARDRAAVQALEEAAREGSFRSPTGFEEAVRKAKAFGLLEDVETAEETMNARRERVLEGLTRVIELDLGGQAELTQLLTEAVRLDTGDAAKAAEHRWEERVKIWVSELMETAKTGSRSRFAALVREQRQRGRTDGIESGTAVLLGRLAVTKQGLAAAAETGTKPEIEKWVKEARELDLVGDIRAGKRRQADRVRSALDALKTAVRESYRSEPDTKTEHRGKVGGEAELVSSAKRYAEHLGVPAALLKRLAAAVEREESVKECRGSGGFGGVYGPNARGHPIDDAAAATYQDVPRQHDVIVSALRLQREGTHQFLANGEGSLEKSNSLQEPSHGDRTPRDLEALGAQKGVPIWPHRMDWGEIERLRLHWQRSASSGSSDGQIVLDDEKKAVNGQGALSPGGTTGEKKSINKHGEGLPGSTTGENEEGESSEEEGQLSPSEGLRARKFQAALTEDVNERLDSNAKAGTSGREAGPQLSRPLLEAVAGGSGFLGALQTLDLALEGLRGLGPKGQLAKWCPSLTSLRLDVNRLTSLVGCFDGLERTLETVSVKDNQVGSVRGLEPLKNLRTLRLDANVIQRLGFDADVSGGSLWPSLTELGLSTNRLTRLSGLGGVCANLEGLKLAGNGLRRLEGALRGLSRLRVLDVSRNKLRGRSLWSELRHCPLLTSLVASSNKLTDLPSGSVFPGSVLLRELWLNGNGIRRLEVLCWLPNLQRLYLQDNAIEGVGSLWGFLNLEVLDLSFNCISDPADLRHLGCLRSLRTLQLNDNPVASPGHSYSSAVLTAVPWLRELDNEPVTDALRETVLRGLVTGRAGLLTSLIATVRQQETSHPSRKLVLLSENESPFRPEETSEDDMNLLEEGADSDLERDPPAARVKAMWGHVLRAAELAEKNGLLRERQPAARAAGLQHQELCAEWRARLARAARESAHESARCASAGSLQMEDPEEAGLGDALAAGNAIRAGCEGASGRSPVSPVGVRSKCGGSPVSLTDDERVPPSRLVRQLRRCVTEHVRYAAGVPRAGSASGESEKVTSISEASEPVTSDFAASAPANLETSESAESVYDVVRTVSKTVSRNGRYYEQEEQKRQQLVTRLQSFWRGRRDRIRSGLLAEKRKAAESVAAIRIQAFWRGFSARRMKTRHVAREAAARTVQASWRGHFLRKKIFAALLVAKYVDEDGESDFGGGDELENLLAGFEGLSRPGTGAAAGQTSVMKRNGWVSSDATDNGAGATVGVVPRGKSSDPVGISKNSGPVETIPKMHIESERKPASVHPEKGKRNRTERYRTDRSATDRYSTTEAETGRSDPSQNHSTNPSSMELLPSQKLTSDAHKMTSRAPLVPNGLSVNSPPSSVVRLPTLSPERASSSGRLEENKPRLSLPDIRLSSGPPDPARRTSKRLSEPLARSLDGESGLEATARETASNQSTPRGPHVPRSQRKLVKQRESITEIAQEWGFKDESTAAAALRSRDRLLRNAQQERRRKSLQDPEKRLQLFKAQAKQSTRSALRPSAPKARPAWAKPNESSDEGVSSDG